LFDVELSGAPFATLSLFPESRTRSAPPSAAPAAALPTPSGLDPQLQATVDRLSKKQMRLLKKREKRQAAAAGAMPAPGAPAFHITCLRWNEEIPQLLAAGHSDGNVVVWNLLSCAPCCCFSAAAVAAAADPHHAHPSFSAPGGNPVLSLCWGRKPAAGQPSNWMSGTVLVCGLQSGDIVFAETQGPVTAAASAPAPIPLSSLPVPALIPLSRAKIDSTPVECLSFVPP
jgi:hypothetical protein